MMASDFFRRVEFLQTAGVKTEVAKRMALKEIAKEVALRTKTSTIIREATGRENEYKKMAANDKD